MNILFFLTPKAMCAYIESDDTLRQAMERMEHSGYAALPVLDKSGKYCGVVTEGDLLWTLKRLCVMDLRQTEEHSISEIEHRRTVQPVRVDTRVEDLLSVAAEQNFVPVIDDKGDFIGIVTRSRILRYYYNQTAGQIAEALHMNPSTVRSRLLRGRQSLRTELQKGDVQIEDLCAESV